MARAVATTIGGQPALILKEGASRTTGRGAHLLNIVAAKAVCEVVRSTLGPRGMDKMLVSAMGEITVTNDGATILKQMDVQHPVAKIIAEVAKTTDKEVGDGTTSAVILVGELLRKAEDLLKRNVHPSTIINGYIKAAEQCIKLYHEAALPVKSIDRETLKKVASTAIATKILSEHGEKLAEIGVDAILAIAEKTHGVYNIDLDNIKVDKKPGESLSETNLVSGVIVCNEVAHPDMPKKLEDPKIALLEEDLEVRKTQFDAKINISSPEKMKQFQEAETKMLNEKFQKIVDSGANVIINQKGIDDVLLHFLAKRQILAVKRANHLDMLKLAKATGARIVTKIDDLSPEQLGHAKVVEERKIAGDKWVFVEGCENPRAVTVLIRGGTKNVVEEAERAIHDIFCVVRDVVISPKIVVGGGAVETEVSSELRRWAERYSGKEQLAMLGFAEAIESIPIALAENAGMNPIDVMTELRSKHKKGDRWAGVDVRRGRVEDMRKLDVFEPLAVKEQIVKSASEAASVILRIDDIIAAAKQKESPPRPRYPAGAPPLERENREPAYM